MAYVGTGERDAGRPTVGGERAPTRLAAAIRAHAAPHFLDDLSGGALFFVAIYTLVVATIYAVAPERQIVATRSTRSVTSCGTCKR